MFHHLDFYCHLYINSNLLSSNFSLETQVTTNHKWSKYFQSLVTKLHIPNLFVYSQTFKFFLWGWSSKKDMTLAEPMNLHEYPPI